MKRLLPKTFRLPCTFCRFLFTLAFVLPYLVASPSLGQIMPLTIGHTHEDTLENNTVSDRYSIALAEGQQLLLFLEKNYRWKSCILLRFQTLSGTPVAQWLDFDYDHMVEYTVPEGKAGPYYLEIYQTRHYWETYPVNYRITALSSDLLSSLQIGQATEDQLSRDSERDYYTVDLTSGQRILLHLEKSFRWNSCVSVHFQGPSGITVAQANNDAYDQTLDFTAQQTGRYFVHVYQQDHYWHTYPVTYSLKPLTQDLLPPLEPNVTIADQLLRASERDYYTLGLSAGDHILLRLEKGFRWNSCVRVTLDGPFGETMAEAYNDPYDQTLEFTAQTEGIYYILVYQQDHYWETYPVGYRFTAYTPDFLPALGIGDPFVGGLVSASERDIYTLELEEGQHLILQLEKSYKWNTCVIVRYGSPFGETIVQYFDHAYNRAAEFTAQQGGTYYVIVFQQDHYWETYPVRYMLLPVTVAQLPNLDFNMTTPARLLNNADRDYFVMELEAETHTIVELKKPYQWLSCLRVRSDGPAGNIVAESLNVDGDQLIELWVSKTSTYFFEVFQTDHYWQYYPVTYYLLPYTTKWSVLVDSVTPGSVGRGLVTFEIKGRGFLETSSVYLQQADNPSNQIEAIRAIYFVNSSHLMARFDLSSAEPNSTWNLIVETPGYGQGGLSQAVHVTGQAPFWDPWVNISVSPQVRVGRETPMLLKLGNNGDVDLYDVMIRLSLPANAKLSIDQPYPVRNQPWWSEVTPGYVHDGRYVAWLWAFHVPAGMNLNCPMTVTFPSGHPHQMVSVDFELLVAERSPFSMTGNYDFIDTSPIFQALADSVTQAVEQVTASDVQMASGISPVGLIEDVKTACHEWVHETLGKISPVLPVGTFIGGGIGLAIGFVLGHPYLGAIVGGSIGQCFDQANMVWHVVTLPIKWAMQQLNSVSIELVTSWDPNDKYGSDGHKIGENMFIRNDETLNYVVRFENMPKATASAEFILITDQLDSNLDFASVEIGESRLGGTLFFPHVIQNGETNTLAWTFSGVNLPPNSNPPAGEGYVSFSVRPKEGLPSATVVNNIATIVFDTNEPIETPPVRYMLDAGAPTSRVVSATQPTLTGEVTLTLEGLDDPGGCGVHTYDIWISTDSGPFERWLQTDQSSVIFSGKWNRHYGFACIATDRVGRVESKELTEEASVDMGPDPGPLICEGDLDRDLDVDGLDLSKFAANYGLVNCSEPCMGDFNGDRNVDDLDLSMIASDLGKSNCPPQL